MPRALFDDDDDDDEREDGGARDDRARGGRAGATEASDDDGRSSSSASMDDLRVNAAYAASEDDAERESSDSSETESDEDEGLELAFDGAFAEALTRIRRRDPSIYDEKTKFFDDGEAAAEAAAERAKTKEKKPKAATLREVTANQLLEGGATALEDAEAEAEAMRASAGPSYVEEQAALKSAFKDAAEGAIGGDSDEDDDGGLVVKRRAEQMSGATEKLSEYFGDEDALSKEEKFLRDYVLEKQWLKGEENGMPRGNVIGGDSSSDEDDGGDDASDSELLERAEEFEHNYNFRFEEPGGDRLVSHSRHIEGLIRREDTKRRDKRKKVKERKESERAKLLAEVRRLKNLKREEIENKMRQIRSIGGLPEEQLKDDLLNTEFDPEAHDRAMAEMYGEDYYEGEDGEATGALQKPEFGDLEEELAELLAAEGGGDDDEEGEGDGEEEGEEEKEEEKEEENEGDAEPDVDIEENKYSKRAAKKWRKELEKKMEEYYKLDAEDFIAGELPTRFPYRDVAPKMFGLTTRDILTMDDKSLNQIVGLKKLAPYRDDADEAAVGANQRARARRMAKEFYAKQTEKKKRKKSRDSGGKKKKDGRDDGDSSSDETDEDTIRARSYADAAFGKKKKSSKDSSKKDHPDDRPLSVQDSGVGKNARKNAKKRAKKKAKQEAENTA
ncbi:KRI1-like family C-terminal-domain-containing protein [Ostreococcus tauri]|uniref:KRI1-like family C-terminal-domain-containing protein n=1 Tax=Ostreococcus tauri TaxID=70448 RepID=A0A1Y5IBS9_OSTTA|nr:KRI1-like family C-terminal-domain-containing protein [Ostreococcus tauri]